MLKAIIFDYDGVIVDSFKNIFEIYQTMCTELGKTLPAKTLDEFRKIYGKTYIECYHNLGIHQDEREKAEKIYKREVLKKSPKLFDGISDVLKELHKQYKLILVSASHKDEVLQKLGKFGITTYFARVIAKEDETATPLSKAQEMIRVLREENLAPNEVISIGDRDIDYEQSTNAGLRNIILVEYGWGYHKETLPHQKVLVNAPRDLIKAVASFE